MTEILSFKSISELKNRVYLRANELILTINSLKDIIYENSSNKPKYTDEIVVNKKDISLLYIQKGIDYCNLLNTEIKEKIDYLLMIKNKNEECLEIIKLIRRDKKYN